MRTVRRNRRPRWPTLGFALCLLSMGSGCSTSSTIETSQAPPPVESKPTTSRPAEHATPATSTSDWLDLLHARPPQAFTATAFDLPGDVEWVGETLRLGWGDPLTGIHWGKSTQLVRELRQHSYELEVEAARLDGADFFCGLTFPVGTQHATLVVGGWGGSLVGLSCLDGADASENETQSFQAFEDRKFYRIRVTVDYRSPGSAILSAWIDDQRVIHVDTEDRELSLRMEVEESKPLGIASFMTETAIRRIRVRTTDPTEQSDAPKR